MNWIKVEPNPADNDAHPERLPALEKVVWVVYEDYDGASVMTFGGRTDSGENMGWLWAVDDNRSGMRRNDPYDDLTADDDYRVTYWAEIEWPEEGK